MEDFRQTWKLLSIYLKMEISDDAISDLAVTIDRNQDGSIDIDEFMEAFRLTDKKSRLERGRSMFMGTNTDLTKLDTDPNIWPETGNREGGGSSDSGSDIPVVEGEEMKPTQAALLTHPKTCPLSDTPGDHRRLESWTVRASNSKCSFRIFICFVHYVDVRQPLPMEFLTLISQITAA